jgi:hypothetical protein
MRRFLTGMILFYACITTGMSFQQPAQSALASVVQQQGSVPAGTIATQLVGRMLVDSSGNAQWIGYCAFLAGITGSFFSGTPSEATAYFTFQSTQFQEQTIPNGNLTQLIPTSTNGPIEISIYLNTSPSGNFQNPATFSQGQLLAQIQPQRAMGTVAGSLVFAAGTYDFVNSSDFTFDGQTYNLAKLTPSLTISLIFGAPVAGSYGSTTNATIFSFGGYGLAVGNPRVVDVIPR